MRVLQTDRETTYIPSFVENTICPSWRSVFFTGIVVVCANIVTVCWRKGNNAFFVSIKRLAVINRALQLVTAKDIEIVALAYKCADLKKQ